MLTTLDKLDDGKLPDVRAGWIVSVTITLMAFVLRFVGVATPNKLIFDETYYPKDAFSLLKYGYEGTWPAREIADPSIVGGKVDLVTSNPSFIAHPPLGKWLIAAGEYVFGMNAFGWRIMAVIFGSLLVFATIRLTRRLARSTLVGGIAGLLLCFDGLAFTMSRIGLLDIFQATFLVTAVACVLADRDWFRHRLANYLRDRSQPDLDGAYGPLTLWRPWRIGAGIAFGCACAVKWNSIYVLAAFGIVSVVWDVSARHLAGASKRAFKAIFLDAPLAFVYLVINALISYVLSWSGWLFSSGGWARDWGAKNPDALSVKLFGAPLASLWNYHVEMYGFHTGSGLKGQTHTYASHPISWPFMIRPVGFDAVNDIKPGTSGCTAATEQCLQVINGMGTPILWWLAAAALVAGFYWWITGEDWRFGVPVLASLAVWLPWFMYAQRPIFFFYAICLIPFTVANLALVAGKILGPATADRRRRKAAIIVGTAIFAVILNFAFIYPVLTDATVPRSMWLLRMWLPSWI